MQNTGKHNKETPLPIQGHYFPSLLPFTVLLQALQLQQKPLVDSHSLVFLSPHGPGDPTV